MPRSPQRPRPLVGKVFSGRHVVRLGLLTKDDLRTAAWQRLFHTVYADALVHVSHRTRCEAVARWLLPPEAAIAGRSAAVFHGGLAPADTDPVEVLTTHAWRRGPRSGLRVHVGERSDDEVVRFGDTAVTSVERTCWDVSRWHGVVEAVAVIDSLLACRAVDRETLRQYGATHNWQRGWRRFEKATALADAGAESPQESRLRVRLVLAGLPRPTTHYVIADRGRFVARVDLAWPDLRVAVEYDGVWHAEVDQFDRDRQRLNRMRAEGWVVIHVTAKRLRDDLDGIVVELRDALRRAKIHPQSGIEGLRTPS
jgi:hypothetical protein